MEWIEMPMGLNPNYTQPMLALRPHEAKVLVSALEQPLKDCEKELVEIKTLKMQDEPITCEQNYRQLLLEEILDIVGEFVAQVETK